MTLFVSFDNTCEKRLVHCTGLFFLVGSEKLGKIMEIIQVKISDIQPYGNNPRKNDEAVPYVANSIKEFGFKVPIVMDKDNVIIAGHTRYKAAKKLGMKTVPCIIADDLTDEQVQAFRLADNKVAEAAEWDFELLESELDQIIDFDMSDFGFDFDFELEDEKTSNDAPTEHELTGAEKEQIDNAWRQYASEYIQQFDLMLANGFAFSGISKGLAKTKFLEAKYLKKRYPRYLSLAFNPMQFVTNGDNYSAYDGLKMVVDGDIKVDRLRFVTSDNMNQVYTGSLSFGGARMPLDFPVELARNLISEFAKGGKVLDPCHGWGGRLIGAMLEDIEEYTGVDPSPYQHKGVESIYNTFKEYCNTKAEIIESAFENAEIKADYYDFALTSPPYFDTETYLGGEQSHTKYSNYELWRDGFYTALIKQTYDALKKDAVFALQVGSQRYPLRDDGIKIAESIGFTVEEIRGTDITNNFNEKDESHAEVIIVLRK